MINKTIGELHVIESITDPQGDTFTSLSGSGGSGGVGWSHNGVVTANSDVLLHAARIPAGGSYGPSVVTAIDGEGHALSSNTSVRVGHLDSGGSFSDDTGVVFGDGSTLYIESPQSEEWTNDLGSEATGAIIFRNSRTSDIDLYTSGVV